MAAMTPERFEKLTAEIYDFWRMPLAERAKVFNERFPYIRAAEDEVREYRMMLRDKLSASVAPVFGHRNKVTNYFTHKSK